MTARACDIHRPVNRSAPPPSDSVTANATLTVTRLGVRTSPAIDDSDRGNYDVALLTGRERFGEFLRRRVRYRTRIALPDACPCCGIPATTPVRVTRSSPVARRRASSGPIITLTYARVVIAPMTMWRKLAQATRSPGGTTPPDAACAANHSGWSAGHRVRVPGDGRWRHCDRATHIGVSVRYCGGPGPRRCRRWTRTRCRWLAGPARGPCFPATGRMAIRRRSTRVLWWPSHRGDSGHSPEQGCRFFRRPSRRR